MIDKYLMNIEVLIGENEIRDKVRELSYKIKKNYENQLITLVSILKGSFIFSSDLIRELVNLGAECEIYFLNVKSYNGFYSSGEVKIDGDLSFVKNKNIIIVEDIFDSGLTLFKIYERILEYKPKRVEICVLLYKEKVRKVSMRLNYIGFKIPDKFVVGYGLDYNEKYRGLPYIGVIG